MLGFKRQLFVSYFCREESGAEFFGSTSVFKTAKVTPEFLDYMEMKLKDSLKVKELTILYWRFY